MLKGKTIILGVSGSIAAYKTASLASALKKLGADVHVLMTQNAANFIHPITFETLTGNKCLVDTFDRNFQFQVEHISIAKKAELVMLAPASANLIGKLAGGIADDMLTTTIMACRCPIYVSPAMNTRMFENPIVQRNIQILKDYGYRLIEPAAGYLACGDTGQGKMPEPDVLLEYILQELAFEKDLLGKKILITAGPTEEAIDPVRYITNHSSGKMGYALASRACMRGAEVTLVTGPTGLKPWPFLKVVRVTTAGEMFAAVTAASDSQDIIIKAAAVADYRPARVSDQKVKKSEEQFFLELERTEDILQYLGDHKKNSQLLCGFAMETEHLISNARAKLGKKNLDMIAANNLKVEGAGFQTDTNVLTLITQNEEVSLKKMSKEEAAGIILDKLLSLWECRVSQEENKETEMNVYTDEERRG
ncbi:MAG: bifunctional phosphopantothenoylcysteine decarboxylase/phosphopantothenate--cysteine ligase CoaBC [Lachnospiraceae bacterium]